MNLRLSELSIPNYTNRGRAACLLKTGFLSTQYRQLDVVYGALASVAIKPPKSTVDSSTGLNPHNASLCQAVVDTDSSPIQAER